MTTGHHTVVGPCIAAWPPRGLVRFTHVRHRTTVGPPQSLGYCGASCKVSHAQRSCVRPHMATVPRATMGPRAKPRSCSCKASMALCKARANVGAMPFGGQNDKFRLRRPVQHDILNVDYLQMHSTQPYYDFKLILKTQKITLVLLN